MRLMVAVEVVFVLVFLAGVALVFVPAALIVGGLLGVLAIERASARRPSGGDVVDLRSRGRAA
ncbi:hypothetical protein [Nonomuraea gerenzanensis]|uniref:Uncharacterized protein n=1 Tax=Nonomuraea gerenzanensis TaxID=93944 RepID=A0A1M4BKW6_9ACTN|nr:hypothetical protein [Nonomuraea gerenzanensis]UBU10022.1 hypothetical protein LCN96_37475 [Nonomuraea gerenzanensis]SAP16269.1 hypothetical protein BN4615_P10932 [Nonomuraea gerenzanensis]